MSNNSLVFRPFLLPMGTCDSLRSVICKFIIIRYHTDRINDNIGLSMKKVLIVDDDVVTRSLLSRVLKPHEKDFEVLTAKNGKEAASIITQQKIDLVITDLQMPEMDGFALMTYLNDHHPEIPFFIMTAFGDSEIKSKVKKIGSIKYFEKPLNIDVITDCIFDELNAGAIGEIEGISLASFLQLIEMEKKTCTLHVKAYERSGIMYFLKGELMAAETADLHNLEAVYEMICWDRIKIGIENTCKIKDKEIEQPLMSVLMEGLKKKDEKEHEDKTKKTPLKPLKSFSQNKS